MLSDKRGIELDILINDFLKNLYGNYLWILTL